MRLYKNEMTVPGFLGVKMSMPQYIEITVVSADQRTEQ